MTLQRDPFQTQGLRNAAGLAVMLPLIGRAGFAACRPRNAGRQFTRGAGHALGLCLWLLAVPHTTLADTLDSAMGKPPARTLMARFMAVYW